MCVCEKTQQTAYCPACFAPVLVVPEFVRERRLFPGSRGTAAEACPSSTKPLTGGESTGTSNPPHAAGQTRTLFWPSLEVVTRRRGGGRVIRQLSAPATGHTAGQRGGTPCGESISDVWWLGLLLGECLIGCLMGVSGGRSRAWAGGGPAGRPKVRGGGECVGARAGPE